VNVSPERTTAATDRGVRVRDAGHADVDAVLPLYEWLFAAPGSPPPDWDPAAGRCRLDAVCGAPDSGVLLAEDDHEVLGFCVVHLDILSVRFGRRAWVEDLAVAPQARSRGTGSLLLHAAASWAHGRGASHLELDSARARHDAHRFYERHDPNWRTICFGWELPLRPAGGADER
jgi:GNAT superfamily N-acetyltransferase